MTPRVRNYAILILAFLLIAGLMILGREHPETNRYDLLLLGWVMLAAYLEELPAALASAGVGLLVIMAGSSLGWLPPKTGPGDLLGLGAAFTLAAIWCQDREYLRKIRTLVVTNKQQELHAIQDRLSHLQGQLEASEQQLKGLKQIYEAAKKLSGFLNLNALLDEAGMIVAKIFSTSADPVPSRLVHLAFYLPEGETGPFRRHAATGHGFSSEGFPEWLRPPGESSMGFATLPVMVQNAPADEHYRWLVESTPFRSLMMIPLVTQDTLAGVMILAAMTPAAFTAEDFEQAEVLGKQIALPLRKCRLYHTVEMLSLTDTQTGLYVHRFFQERLRIEIHRAERYHQFLSLIMLDMDHFKKVNDHYGHLAGDAVLTEVATRIKSVAGPSALVARYGGEEFAVLLPNTAKALAMKIAQNIHDVVKATPVSVEGKRLVVTISGGVSTYPEDALERSTLITTADTALYEAKRNGRNLILAFEATDNPAHKPHQES